MITKSIFSFKSLNNFICKLPNEFFKSRTVILSDELK